MKDEKYKITGERLKYLQGLSLREKIHYSECTINEWYEYWEGQVFVSFSGGKDSTVLLDLVRNILPDIEGVFSDTGLEYPEIKTFVKEKDNITIVRSKITFNKVIEKYGYPIISKHVSRCIKDLTTISRNNTKTRNLRLTGITSNGDKCTRMMLPAKYRYLINAPFKISDLCCEYLKKWPINNFIRINKKQPITGVMATESSRRKMQYLKTGCNLFNARHPISNPLSIWSENDIWEYINRKNLSYSTIYDKGENRTGCMFCMFGVHLEKEPNRFQRMKVTHPKHWKYCMEKLELREVLKYIGVKYE